MDKVLYLGVTQFLEEHKNFVDVNQIYRNIPKFLKPLRKIFFDLDLPFKRIWLVKEFQKTIEKYDTVILSATLYNIKISRIIDSYNFRNKRFIFWYWNPVEATCFPSEISKLWEKWSFDKKDCEEYNLKYNNTYYFKKFVVPSKDEVRFQVSFVGQDKGRLPLLLNIKEKLDKSNITSYFHVVKDSTSNMEYNYMGRINYSDILEILRTSNILLDIVQESQSGLTLRVMEGLFFSKKVITNNIDINRYNFYNPNNIFIWGKDPESKLMDFIRTDYVPVSEDILNGYTIDSWLNNFNKYQPNG
ncbi:hypothetical protein [Sphingobacterium multivorum]|uniref:hypothetical protein n=1 Tax=Sphingobacterium multivorum TaxID=28454 RepID=UPI0031BA999B